MKVSLRLAVPIGYTFRSGIFSEGVFIQAVVGLAVFFRSTLGTMVLAKDLEHHLFMRI